MSPVTGDYMIVDLNPQFVDFCQTEGLNAICGNILDQCGILVSPANSYGFMDGGLDWYIAQKHPGVGGRVKEAIARKGGVLAVGDSVTVHTISTEQPLLIAAPTMHTPATNLNGTINAYLATRAARHAYQQIDWLTKQDIPLLLPGMGTGSGGLSLKVGARQMAEALKPPPIFPNWQAAKRYEQFLIRP